MNCAKNVSQPAKLTINMGLKEKNTFGLESSAEFTYEITSPEQLPDLMQSIREQNLVWRVLGGGSNVILPAQLLGTTLLMNITGQEILDSDENGTLISVGGGVNWHEFVSWTLEQNLPGLENVAFIPCTVGAAPMQYIDAYGV